MCSTIRTWIRGIGKEAFLQVNLFPPCHDGQLLPVDQTILEAMHAISLCSVVG